MAHWEMHLVEIKPLGKETVQWYLLTGLPVGDEHAAAEIVSYYLQSWRFEDFFRVLKSGCHVAIWLHPAVPPAARANRLGPAARLVAHLRAIETASTISGLATDYAQERS